MISNHNYLVGITSLWLLIPSELCLLKYYKTPHYIGLGSLTLITSIVSTITWHNTSNKLYWYLDHLLANSLFLSLNGYYIITKKRTHTPGGFIPFSVSIFTIYNVGYITQKYNYKNATLLLHLLFRYVGFWFTYITLVQIPSITLFIGVTSGYILQLLMEWKNNHNYLYGALRILCPIQGTVLGVWLCNYK